MAETPTLEFARQASEQGVEVLRYTDRESLDAAFSGLNSDAPKAPGEIALPPLRRIASNRGLVVRGVDPRDIVTVGRAEALAILGQIGSSGLGDVTRDYRVSLVRTEIDQVAIPERFLMEALQSGDPAAQLLIQKSTQRRTPSLAAAKRFGDLQATWNRPAKGERYAIQDGLEPRLIQLDKNEIPGQTMFTVDGGAAVPFIFTSRAFRLWARATLSRSISWTPRLAVTRTFETFPFPFPFEVAREQREDRPWLELAETNSLLTDLVEEVAEHTSSDGAFGETLPENLAAAADAALLRLYDLPPESSDLDVLDRLVTFNRR